MASLNLLLPNYEDHSGGETLEAFDALWADREAVDL